MHSFILLLGAVVMASCVLAAPKDQYTTAHDHLNIDEMLKNERTVKHFVDCLMDKGNCSPPARDFKKVLPDALKTTCAKCNDNQKNIVRKIANHLITHKPEEWKQLQHKYDPKAEHLSSFEKFIKGTA